MIMTRAADTSSHAVSPVFMGKTSLRYQSDGCRLPEKMATGVPSPNVPESRRFRFHPRVAKDINVDYKTLSAHCAHSPAGDAMPAALRRFARRRCGVGLPPADF